MPLSLFLNCHSGEGRNLFFGTVRALKMGSGLRRNDVWWFYL
jgi:hypothetical protein